MPVITCQSHFVFLQCSTRFSSLQDLLRSLAARPGISANDLISDFLDGLVPCGAHIYCYRLSEISTVMRFMDATEVLSLSESMFRVLRRRLDAER